MAGPYEIDWQPPNLLPAFAMLKGAMQQSKANKRSDEYMRMEQEAIRNRADRESKALARQEEQDKYNRAVASFNALPGLQRMARKNVAGANANPYGYKFEEETAPGPSLRESGINVMDAQGDQYGNHARAMLGQSLAAPEDKATLGPGEEGPEQDPAAEMRRFSALQQGEEGPEQDIGAEAARFAPPTAPAEAGPTSEAPAQGFTAAQAMLGQPQAKRLFMTYQGQRSEVPTVADTSGFGEQYDAMYNALLEGGEDPHKARAFVAARAKQDMADTARDSRLADQIEARRVEAERSHPSVETQSEFLDRRLKQSDVNSRRAANARIASSAPNLKADAANARDMSVLRQQGAAVRSTSQFNKLAAADKTVRGLMTNIASGTVPLQHADAQIQLARFFRQAQPTEGEMHMLYNNLGGTMDKWNQFVARMSKGDLSPEQMRQLKASAQTVAKEHREDVRRFSDVARHMLGPGFENMPDQAQALYEGMGAELGLEGLPPLFSTEGGVSLGSGKRPTVRPKGTKKTELDQLEDALDRMNSGGR